MRPSVGPTSPRRRVYLVVMIAGAALGIVLGMVPALRGGFGAGPARPAAAGAGVSGASSAAHNPRPSGAPPWSAPSAEAGTSFASATPPAFPARQPVETSAAAAEDARRIEQLSLLREDLAARESRLARAAAAPPADPFPWQRQAALALGIMVLSIAAVGVALRFGFGWSAWYPRLRAEELRLRELQASVLGSLGQLHAALGDAGAETESSALERLSVSRAPSVDQLETSGDLAAAGRAFADGREYAADTVFADGRDDVWRAEREPDYASDWQADRYSDRHAGESRAQPPRARRGAGSAGWPAFEADAERGHEDEESRPGRRPTWAERLLDPRRGARASSDEGPWTEPVRRKTPRGERPPVTRAREEREYERPPVARAREDREYEGQLRAGARQESAAGLRRPPEPSWIAKVEQLAAQNLSTAEIARRLRISREEILLALARRGPGRGHEEGARPPVESGSPWNASMQGGERR